MITKLSHTTVWVLDQDAARDFYANKLGFQIHTDERMDDFRWLTVSAPDQPDHELILLEPGPPMMDDETAAQVRGLVAQGVLGPGAFETDDCRATYAALRERGVNYSPSRPSGSTGSRRRCATTRATFSMTERSKAHAPEAQ